MMMTWESKFSIFCNTAAEDWLLTSGSSDDFM
jgi:hypothetical protein